MTDIQRHLKGIRKILYTQLEQADNTDTPNWDAVRSALRTYLPKSYGIGSGRLTGAEGSSESIQIVLYDVPLAGGYYPADTPLYPIETALLTLDFAFTHTPESLAGVLARIASVKRLATFREPEPRPDANQPVGQVRRTIPKDCLPFALAYFDRLENSRSRYEDALALMRPYPAELLPNQIDIIGQHAQFLNPLLEHYPANWFDLGWSRTPNLHRPAICYGCKCKFLRRHFFYDQLCMQCGDLNYSKRVQSIDLSGYYVLVTGARVKIGYAVALRLLRAGAEVIITTRFPRDAARRYSEEADFTEWCDHLHIYGLDLRQITRLEVFIAYLEATYPHLDAIINNAAQTVKRPPEFYAHLLPLETMPPESLPEPIRPLLSSNETDTGYLQPSIAGLLEAGANDSGFSSEFPTGQYDEHGQQVDNRDFNSWVMRLEDVPPIELAEVHVVNAIAPGILTGQLKRMLLRSPHKARFVINVSAAEGRFAQYKSGYHPHTNMAKAALNMLTRTIAYAYAQDNIYVTSVDPGWVSDQVPHTGDHSRAAANERIPIDLVDAAARVCDPIFAAVSGDTPTYGVLLKDYEVAEW